MARTKLNQRSANRVDVPMGATGNRPPPKLAIAVLVVSILTAIWAAAMLTPYGRVAYLYVFMYSEYFMGVVTLVSLSITIMVGLVSTDRLVLSIRQRVLLQSAHRTTGIIAVTAMVAHVWTQIVDQKIRLIDAFIPFIAPFNTVLFGMGTLSGWTMMIVMWTGIARSRFIGRGKPWMWRSIHAVSYLLWPIALVHGLAAGRAAATWVIVSYVICVLGVLAGLAVRLSVSLNRRKDFSSTATGAMKPVGAVVPTAAQSAPVVKKRPSRRAETETAAAPEPWVPASGARSSAAPTSGGAPADVTPYARYMEEPPRRSRYDDETQIGAIRPQRGERYDEPTGRMSRRALELEAPPAEPSRGRRRAAEQYEPEETPRGRRYSDGYDDAPRGRRYADEPEEAPRGRRYADGYDDAPRGRRYADEYDEAPRGRRYAEEEPPAPAPAPRQQRRMDVDRADSGRHSRSEFVDLAAPDEDRWGAPDQNYPDPNFMEPDETPTLVDMASRRARRQQADGGRMPAGRGARGGGRSRGDDLDDAGYWRQLRGEAQ